MSCQQKYCSGTRNQRCFFYSQDVLCVFGGVRIRVKVSVRVCLMHICLISRVKVRLRVMVMFC